MIYTSNKSKYNNYVGMIVADIILIDKIIIPIGLLLTNRNQLAIGFFIAEEYKMTNKEAIEHLKNINDRYPCSLDTTFQDECEMIAINLAIKALEKERQD